MRCAGELEKPRQRAVRQLCIACGCTVFWMSQARQTGQTPGVGDLYVFSPKWGAFWVETKREIGGRQSPAQRDFQMLCVAARVPYILGGVNEVRDFLARGVLPKFSV